MGEFQHAGEAGMARIGDLGDWTPLAGFDNVQSRRRINE